VKYILTAVITCAFKIRRKTVLQTVLPIKRLAKSFYKSADYDGDKNNQELFLKNFSALMFLIVYRIKYGEKSMG
jgi:hypothetical protein